MSGEMCGAGVLVQMKDELAAYQTVGGLQERSLTLNNEPVDITNADSVQRWREIMDQCGTKSLTISGNGIAKDNAAGQKLRAAAWAGYVRDWKFTLPGFGVAEGPFKISTLEFSAAHNNVVMDSFTAESAGEIVWTDL